MKSKSDETAALDAALKSAAAKAAAILAEVEPRQTKDDSRRFLSDPKINRVRNFIGPLEKDRQALRIVKTPKETPLFQINASDLFDGPWEQLQRDWPALTSEPVPQTPEQWEEWFGLTGIPWVDARNGRLPMGLVCGRVRAYLKGQSAKQAAPTAHSKRKYSRHKRADIDPIADARLVADWKSSGMTQAQFVRNRGDGMTRADLNRAIDRDRRRKPIRKIRPVNGI